MFSCEETHLGFRFFIPQENAKIKTNLTNIHITQFSNDIIISKSDELYSVSF